MPAAALSFTPAVPLAGGHDGPWQAVLDRMQPTQRIRGMFIANIADRIERPARLALFQTLQEPPRAGVHLPFVSYPQHDYLRIVLAAADAGDAGLSNAERIRRLARDDFTTFARSMLGAAVMAAIRTPRAALLKTPWVYDTVAPAGGGSVTGVAVDDHRVQLCFARYPHFWPYQLGQLEGLVETFGVVPHVVVEREGDDLRTVYTVSHG